MVEKGLKRERSEGVGGQGVQSEVGDRRVLSRAEARDGCVEEDGECGGGGGGGEQAEKLDLPDRR